MNIDQLESYNLGDAVKFNTKLNPKLWAADEHLLPEVRNKLLEIADEFREFLGVSDIQLKDITISGSNAAYTYTPHSDIDLHLVVDLPEADVSEVYRELFDAKKYQFNDQHNIKIGGYDVELYVQDANQPHHSQGIYSILNNDWIDVPKRRKPEVDDISTRSKYDDLSQRIDQALASGNAAAITSLTEKIRDMRQAGLDTRGEFGPENLAFKMLRTQGKIKELYDARNAAKDQELSLKERKSPHSVFTYGFKHEESVEPKVVEDTSTVTAPTDEEIIKDFIEFCVKELKIESMPTVKLRRDPQWSVVNKTFGRYNDATHTLEVAFGQRHVMDILRTAAHELTHKHQHERESVPTDAGETGSPWENEANARAGVLMRDYGQLHPELFDASETELEESASGYIPTKKQAKDPRWSMALTQDIRPGQLGKEANKLKLRTDKQGVPQIANPNGLFEKLALELNQFKQKKIFTVNDFKIDAFESLDTYRRWQQGPKTSSRGITRYHANRYAGIFVDAQLVEATDIFAQRKAEATKFSQNFKQLDQRENVKIAVGNLISLLSSTVVPGDDAHDSRIELSGFVTPKKIVKINLDNNDKIDTLEFSDGSRFPEEAEFTTVGGTNITNTILFSNPAVAKKAFSQVWMLMSAMEGQGWKVEKYLSEELEQNTLAEAVDLNFHTIELKENQIQNYAKQYFESYNIEKPHIKFISNIKRFTNPKLKESSEINDIKPFIDLVQNLNSNKQIKVGDKFAVLAFEVVYLYREINTLGFTTPKEVADIKLHSDGTINYIKFTDGDRYPRISPATYSGKPIIHPAYFDNRQSAESALTALALQVPEDWDLHTQDVKHGGLSESIKPLSQVPGEVEDDLGNQEATGPEFPPEWPKGTTKIDVSDLTDWYRLGMDISDMDDADPKDYNQGPPQTVVVFPSDEIEQGYLQQFKRLGLKTHDIDPGGEDTTGKHQPKRRLKEEDLNEVRMAPSNLQQWATSPEAQGIRAGFEAELIFRDMTNGDDDDGEYEPDYDADERCRNLDQVIEFFEGGEGYMTSRQLERLREALDERYYEWYDEQMHKDFRDEQEDLIKKVIMDEGDWELDDEIQKQLIMQDVSDDELTAIIQAGEKAPKFNSSKEQILYAEANPLYDKYLDAQKEAEDLLDDLVQDSIKSSDDRYEAALDDFRDNYQIDDDSGFFSDEGLNYMSDVANAFDVEWPYMSNSNSNNGGREWDSLKDSLQDTIDMPVKVSSGYHSATRKEGLWIIEPDSSLRPDDSEDYGLEIVSPPMPLLTALDKLQEVCDWANDSSEGNAYTNDSTGLHMGVSVPYKGGSVDYVKLIMFLGDEYVLQSFGREANTYCASAMGKLKQNVGNSNARYAANVTSAMDLMRGNLIELANREIQKGVGESKYTSVHIQKGYIEFRSAGGDWLAEESADPEKLSSTMLRYARAMQIAADPSAERREYAKKLYKLIAPEGDSELALFSQFAAGELTAEQLKKRWAEKTIGTEKKMNQRWKLYKMVDDVWTAVPGGEWNGYPESEVKNAVWGKYGREALDTGEYQLVNMGEQSWEVYDVNTGKTLEIVKGKSKGEVADQVYDKYVDQGIGFQIRPYVDPNTLTPRAKLAKRITEPKKPEAQKPAQETNERGVPYWEVYEIETEHVVHTFLADTAADATVDGANWLTGVGAEQPDLFAVRPKIKNAQVKDIAPDVAQNFAEPSSQRYGSYADAQQAADQQNQQPQNATDRVGTWAIYDVTLGREISRMDNVSWQQASDRADELERFTGGHNMSVRGLSA